jgi:hypothetical protein
VALVEAAAVRAAVFAAGFADCVYTAVAMLEAMAAPAATTTMRSVLLIRADLLKSKSSKRGR